MFIYITKSSFLHPVKHFIKLLLAMATEGDGITAKTAGSRRKTAKKRGWKGLKPSARLEASEVIASPAPFIRILAGEEQ